MRTTTAARVRKKGDGWRTKKWEGCFGISSSAFLSIQAAATRRHTKKALSRFHNAISSPTSPCYNFSLLLRFSSLCAVLHGGKVFQPIACFSASASPTTFFFLPFSSSPFAETRPCARCIRRRRWGSGIFLFLLPSPLGSPRSLLKKTKIVISRARIVYLWNIGDVSVLLPLEWVGRWAIMWKNWISQTFV